MEFHVCVYGRPYPHFWISVFSACYSYIFSFSLLTIYPKPLYACQSRSRAGGVMPPVLPKICFYRAFLMTKQGALTMLAVAFASRCYRSIIAEMPHFSARASAFWLPWYQRTARPHYFFPPVLGGLPSFSTIRGLRQSPVSFMR